MSSERLSFDSLQAWNIDVHEENNYPEKFTDNFLKGPFILNSCLKQSWSMSKFFQVYASVLTSWLIVPPVTLPVSWFGDNYVFILGLSHEVCNTPRKVSRELWREKPVGDGAGSL